MTLFSRFFGVRQKADPGLALYRQALAAARRPGFYHAGVPDTVDGRFDLLVIHVWLLVRALNRANAQDLGQQVFDAMFADMDDSLRELGVSDTAVGKRIKEMAQVFYGCAQVYGAALDAADQEALEQAVQRNVLAEGGLEPQCCRAVAAYMAKADKALAAQDVAHMVRSGPCYPSFAA